MREFQVLCCLKGRIQREFDCDLLLTQVQLLCAVRQLQSHKTELAACKTLGDQASQVIRARGSLHGRRCDSFDRLLTNLSLLTEIARLRAVKLK